MKGFRSITVLVIALLWQVSWAQNSPVDMLDRISNQIISTLKQHKGNLKKNPQIIYQAVNQYLLPNVDVGGMARSVLGRIAWNKASPAERAEFSDVFTKLIIRTYATPLAQYSNETVKFLPLRGSTDGRFVRVNSVIIRTTGQNIPLSYSLVANSGQWKIYDLSVEGVSLLQSFRAQFSQLLQNSSMHELIKQMRSNQKVA